MRQENFSIKTSLCKAVTTYFQSSNGKWSVLKPNITAMYKAPGKKGNLMTLLKDLATSILKQMLWH